MNEQQTDQLLTTRSVTDVTDAPENPQVAVPAPKPLTEREVADINYQAWSRVHDGIMKQKLAEPPPIPDGEPVDEVLRRQISALKSIPVSTVMPPPAGELPKPDTAPETPPSKVFSLADAKNIWDKAAASGRLDELLQADPQLPPLPPSAATDPTKPSGWFAGAVTNNLHLTASGLILFVCLAMAEFWTAQAAHFNHLAALAATYLVGNTAASQPEAPNGGQNAAKTP